MYARRPPKTTSSRSREECGRVGPTVALYPAIFGDGVLPDRNGSDGA